MPVHDNKKSRAEYVNWIENKWQVRVNESTITRILQRSNQLLSEEEIIAPNAKRYRSVTYPELEQAFLLQENANEHIKMTNILERYIREKKANTMRQTSIDQYFK